MTDPELRDMVCLTLVAGVGPHTFRALLEHYGSAGKVLDASVSSLREVSGIGPKLAEKIAAARRFHDVEAELDLCRQSNVTIVSRGMEDYPASLAEIPDPPSLIYVKGSIEPRDHLAIAIVGSRRCTPYGMRIAERLGSALARVGLTVVSGLARGI
ncbi:DNA-processing protein DprA, partial [Singulisphaera rosea]